jgi:hypothetical protein
MRNWNIRAIQKFLITRPERATIQRAGEMKPAKLSILQAERDVERPALSDCRFWT